MGSNTKGMTIWWVLVFSMFLMGADNSDQNGEEHKKLLRQHRQLSSRIELLKREQDYLVFQSAMYASDSKYLVITLSAKTGQLKYKNRVLKDFPLTLASGRTRRLARGALTLTQKIEGAWSRKLLVFEKSLVLQGPHAPAAELEAGIPRFSLSKRDFKSLYAALESGAKVYILR